MLTDPKLCSQVDALWDKFWTGGLSNLLVAGVVARAVVEPNRDIESLPLAHLHCTERSSAAQVSLRDFVRGRISAFEPRSSRGTPAKNAETGVEGLFESLLAQSFDGN